MVKYGLQLASISSSLVLGAPALANSDQLVDVNDIVPSGRTGQYSHGTYPSEGDRTHAGVDIPAPCKTSSVHAWRDGVVIDVVDSKKDRNFKSLGYMVIIDHGVIDVLGKRTEPPRDCRRPVSSNYAAMGVSSSMA
jgi:murein DD-endopeptidase MepM/ murein hydrolase activator NlpD